MKSKSLICLFILTGAIMLSACSREWKSKEPAIPSETELPLADSIQEFSEKPSGIKEANRLARGGRGPASDFEPTGFYLPPNSSLTLEVEELEQGSGTPTLLIGTYSRYESKWNPQEVPLSEGSNNIQGDEYGGIIYLRYDADDAQTASGKVRLRFVNGHQRHPYYIHGQTSNAQWQAMLNAWPEAPDVLLKSEHAIVVASMSKAVEYRNDDQQQLMEAMDEVFKAEFAIAGLDGANDRHRINVHKLLLTETDMEDTFMAATWYRTWYHRDVVNHILTLDGFRADGWGPWHEIGHHQQQDPWTWSTLGEVTVNIYSLAAERAMGQTESRLVRDGVWFAVQDYLLQDDAQRDYNAGSTDLFVRLAMFQQLWLKYGDAFFQELHRQTREETQELSTDEEKMRYFMLKACTISNNDLADFFRKWGLQVSESVYTEIAALNLATPDEDLTQLTDDPSWASRWKVIGFSSQETSGENGRASNLVDGDPATYWHSRWSSEPGSYPHFVSIDMTGPQSIQGFRVTQRDGQRKIKDLEIQVSNDMVNWETVFDGSLQDSASPQDLELPVTKNARYFKLIAKSAYDGQDFAALAEVAVY